MSKEYTTRTGVRVTMMLAADDVANADKLRALTGAESNAHAVSIALSLASYLAAQIAAGEELLMRDRSGALSRVSMKELGT